MAQCPTCSFPLDAGVAASCPRCASELARPDSGAWPLGSEVQPDERVREPDPRMVRSAGIAFDRASTMARSSTPSPAAPIAARALALVVDFGILTAVSAATLSTGALAYGLDSLRTIGGGRVLDGVRVLVVANPDAGIASAILVATLASGYAIWFLGATGRTPGMARAGLLAQTLDGKPLGFGGAMNRWGAVLLAALPLGLGLLWSIFDEEGRGLHDRIAGTRVILR